MKSSVFGMVLSCVLTAPALAAQTNGALSGVVKDPTGALLAGVQVNLMHEASGSGFTQSSGERGGFSFPTLPVGNYQLNLEIAGFAPHGQTVRLEASRTTDLEVWLSLGIEEEPVLVRASTTLDVRSSRIGETVDNQFLQEVPNGRDVWVVLEETPGIVLDKFNVGGSESGQQSIFSGAGTSYAQNQYNLNGINATDPSALGASSTYYSYDSFEEVQVSTAGHPPEVQSPGVFLNIVLKSGGNQFAGGAAYYFEEDWLQGDNLDNQLRAQGVGQSNRLDRYFDYSAELGGPILKDRAFFYAQISEQQIEPFVIGFFLPSAEPGLDLTELQNRLLRGSWQLGDAHRLSGIFFRNNKLRPHRDASRFRPSPATALYQESTTDLMQVLYSGVLSERTLVDARFSRMDMHFPLGQQPDLDPNAFSRIELTTGIRSQGPGSNRLFERERVQANASLYHYRDDWFLGSHELKFGWEYSRNPSGTTDDLNGSVLYRDFFGLPFQVELYSDPTVVENRAENLAFYVQDSVTRSRLTLNLGVRYDHWNAAYPDQSSVRGPWTDFFRSRGLPAQTQANSNAVSFNAFAPRLGFTYRLNEGGSWLLRGNYSRYYHQIGTSLAGFANPNGRAVALFGFFDINGNGVVDSEMGEIDFDFPTSVNLPSINQISDSLKQPRTDEVSFGIDHELASDLAVGASVIYRRERNLIDDVNVGVPFSEYTEAQALDPGSDLAVGTADDRVIPIHNQSVSSLGRDRFLLTNPEGLRSSYRGLVLEARKRYSSGWQLLSSLTLSQSKGFLPGPGEQTNEGAGVSTPLYDNPNALIGVDGRTFWDRPVVFRASGSHDFWWNTKLAVAYRAQSGQPLYRSVQISQTLDGLALNQGPVEIIADSQGFARQPIVQLLDARVEKEFDFGNRGKLGLIFDLFNVFNANTAVEVAQRRQSFGATLKILPPRVARIGIRYRF